MTPPRKRRRDNEGPVHKAILQYLRTTVRDIWITHAPNEGIDGIARQIAAGKGTVPGTPDLIFCCRGMFCAIEVKAPGNYPSQAQRTAIADIERAGGKVGVARSIDEARALLAEWGIETREHRS